MAEMPPSIGQESNRGFRLISEEYPLPKSRPEVVSLVQDLISAGGVQKLVVEIGKPVKVSRYTQEAPKQNEELPTELLSNDMFANVRNAEIEEFDLDDRANWFEALFRAFTYLTFKGLKPKAFLVQTRDLLRKHLELEKTFALKELYGVEVMVADEVPADVLIFVATKPGEEEIALSLRILMTTR